MHTDKDYNKIKLDSPFFWTGLTCLQVLCHYWAVDYFYIYLNQVPKPPSHSPYIFRIKKTDNINCISQMIC